VDVVICCTTSQEPVYQEPARPARLVVAVGSFTPQAAEIGAATVRASRLYVDDLDSARHEAGDLIRAGIDWGEVRPIAQCLRDRTIPVGPAFFKTVGHAAWDLAAARVAVAQSKA
jgi:1-piperideine-2-carboxylate/1-pyrroline-2-carboxylate reductase [NAD(P)H]